jgi:CRISPR-associated protein Cmr6
MRNAITQLANIRHRGQHPGLILQRFLAHPADGSDHWSREKRELLNAAVGVARDGDLQNLYKAAYERWEASLPDLTARGSFATDGRLIVGLGSENVLETGIRLHHTYGLPIIPGSALKGLAAHYCHEIWGRSAAGDGAAAEDKRYHRDVGDYHRLLFGTTDDSGCAIFHDAWLTPDSRNPLLMDVMTPHHPDYNRDPKTDPKFRAPTDFDSPRPVPFVSVRGTFRVAVSWHGPLATSAANWTNRAFELLTAALREWGVGGKTSSGYGRLAEVEPNTRRTAFSAEALGLPAEGSEVTALLLEAPKRNKPWRATLTLASGEPLSGPIEGERIPANLTPGKEVRLVVAQVDEKSIRFSWPK